MTSVLGVTVALGMKGLIMGWGTRENFDRQSKLLRQPAPYAQQIPTTDMDRLIEGSKKLAAAIYMTKKTYRRMTREELQDFEDYARSAVKVEVKKKGK